MKFIHISDLHLGKRVNEFSMLEEQKYILQQVLDTVQNEAADAVLIAGDIYDKPVPPTEAVVLFDTFLTRLSQMKKEVFIISGNHDSVERLSFGSSLFTAEGIHIAPVFEGNMEKVSLWDDAGEVCVYLLPFIKPSTVRRFYEEDLTDYTKTVQTVIEHTPVDTSKRNVLVAHQFVTGAGRCDSEEVSVGGLDNVDASVFEPFDYVALGHIHNAQHCSRESVRYCGTLLKYSFSEVNHIKSITVVELKEKGKNPQIHTVPVTPLHDMREIKGSYEELTFRKNYMNTPVNDYLHITLTDEEDIPDAISRLRSIYPNIMRLDYDNIRTRNSGSLEIGEAAVERTPLELFEDFYEQQNHKPMSEEQKQLVGGLIESIWE